VLGLFDSESDMSSDLASSSSDEFVGSLLMELAGHLCNGLSAASAYSNCFVAYYDCWCSGCNSHNKFLNITKISFFIILLASLDFVE
jgi:hypothetical protein